MLLHLRWNSSPLCCPYICVNNYHYTKIQLRGSGLQSGICPQKSAALKVAWSKFTIFKFAQGRKIIRAKGHTWHRYRWRTSQAGHQGFILTLIPEMSWDYSGWNSQSMSSLSYIPTLSLGYHLSICLQSLCTLQKPHMEGLVSWMLPLKLECL